MNLFKTRFKFFLSNGKNINVFIKYFVFFLFVSLAFSLFFLSQSSLYNWNYVTLFFRCLASERVNQTSNRGKQFYLLKTSNLLFLKIISTNVYCGCVHGQIQRGRSAKFIYNKVQSFQDFWRKNLRKITNPVASHLMYFVFFPPQLHFFTPVNFTFCSSENLWFNKN